MKNREDLMMKYVTRVLDQMFVLVLLVFLFGYSSSVIAQDEFVPGELIIKLKEGVRFPDIQDELAEDGMGIVDSIPELNLFVIKVPSEDIQNLQDSLSLNPNYLYVDRNYIVSANAIPNDTLFNQQTHFSLIDAQQAWDTETGDPNVVLAILDTGVEASHEDLSGKVLPGCSTLGSLTENNCGSNTNDIDGHGSGVSGTAAAQSNNNKGVAGICWGCQILPVKVLGDNGSGSVVDVIQGILFAKNYALDNPSKKVVINMSLGRQCSQFGISQSEQDAIDLAWNAGVLLVSSAGNSGNNLLQCPASADNMIAVSATNNNDNLSDFSSYGNFVDLAAPGGNLSPYNFIYNVEGNTGNGYTGWVGTSFSSPIVAGLAGLIWSANISLTNTEVDQILRNTAENIGSSQFFGDGRVNANSAVLAAGGPPPTPPPTPGPTSPPPPPTSDPTLTGFNPGLAGQTSSLTVTDADPGSTVVFHYSFATGTHFISSGVCNGQTLSIINPRTIASTVANGSGTATINVPLPQAADGVSLYLQAQVQGSTCAISNRVFQTLGSNPPPPPTPPPPPVIDLVMTPLNPGIAGVTSTLQVTGAPAGETIKFKYALNTGSSAIVGGTCSGQNLGLVTQRNIGMTVADSNGVATINVPIPSAGAGVTLHMQAYTDTGAVCDTSNRVTQTLQ